MNKFTKNVLVTIDKYNMIPCGSTVIAAVSGGYDSLCMVHVLHELSRIRNFKLCGAHLNHSLRDTADEDEIFVMDLCKKLQIQSYTKKVDVKQYAQNNKISFETAGRIIRYDFFEDLMESIPNSITATAHNANDSAESFMMHLLRGSGLNGLTGIKAVRGSIIRPLIEQTRFDIEAYCKENSLIPRIDITNEDDNYTRNDIRHNVIPPIAERGGIESIAKACRLLSADEEFLEEYAAKTADEYISRDEGIISVDAKSFNKLPLSIKRRLIMRVLPKSVKETGMVHIDSIISISEKNYGGKYSVLPGGITAALNNGKIIIKQEVYTND